MRATLTARAAAWRDCGAFLPIDLERVSLRELRAFDAQSLKPLLQDPVVQRFLPGVPRTPAEVARFAAWAERQRCGGGYVCVAVTIASRPIGLIQAWPLDPSAATIEWGFALARQYWGRGLFQESGRAFVSFAIAHLGAERFEARAAVTNDRGSAALRRLGARREGVLRQCLPLNGSRVDCSMWSILAAEWPSTSAVASQPRQLDQDGWCKASREASREVSTE